MNMFKAKNVALLLVLLVMFTVLLSPMDAYAAEGNPGEMFGVEISESGGISLTGVNGSKDDSAKTIVDRAKWIVGLIQAVSIIAVVALLIAAYVKLGAAGDNPSKRKEVQSGLLYKFIAAAGIGTASTAVALFFKLFY